MGKSIRFATFLTFATCFALIFPLLSQNAVLSAADDVWPQLETQHFLILAEPALQPAAMSLSDWEAVLTQYFGRLDEKLAPLFGERTLSPLRPTLGQKPILLICADKRSYLAKLGEYGVLPSDGSAFGSGGFYHPEANVIFTWRQPTDYYSRHVVLHEVAHWYCLQLLGERYAKMPLWLCEGLADFAAAHVWDGQTLRAMQMPRVSLENYPAKLEALLKRLVPEGKISPETVVQTFERLRSDAASDKRLIPYDEYALAWGVTAFLIDEHPTEMQRLFGLLTQHDMAQSWQPVFDESDRPHPTWQRLNDWAGKNQLPWQWVWNHWEDDGRCLIGVSDSTALIVQNPTNEAINVQTSEEIAFQCEVEPLLDHTIIGLVFDGDNDSENGVTFEMLQFRRIGQADAAWRHVRFAQKKWEALSSWQKIARTTRDNASPNEFAINLCCRTSSRNRELHFFYNGRLITKNDASDDSTAAQGNGQTARPRFGLAVQSGAARFDVRP